MDEPSVPDSSIVSKNIDEKRNPLSQEYCDFFIHQIIEY